MKKKNVFSLIELLLVVAIIAILAALLIPTLLKSRDSANSAACANNLNQLGKALGQYQTTYIRGGFIPGHWSGKSSLERLLLASIGQNESEFDPNSDDYDFEIWACPSDSTDYEGDWNRSYSYNATQSLSRDTNEFNDEGALSGTWNKNVNGARSSFVNNASGIIYLADFWDDSSYIGQRSTFLISKDKQEENMDQKTTYRMHDRQANYLFLDGHVKKYKPEDTEKRNGSHPISLWADSNWQEPGGWGNTF